MSESSKLTAVEIQQCIPHRYPFLMIDQVLSLTDDKIIAAKCVTMGEPFFQGHFPGMPVMPGVLIVEAMAQAGGVMAARQLENFDLERQVMMFASIDKVKFRQQVTPGDRLILEVEPLRRGRMWKLRGTATVDEKVVCTAEFLAIIANRPGTGSADKAPAPKASGADGANDE